MGEKPPEYLDLTQFEDSPVTYTELGLPELGTAFGPELTEEEWDELIDDALAAVDLVDAAEAGFEDGLDFGNHETWSHTDGALEDDGPEHGEDRFEDHWDHHDHDHDHDDDDDDDDDDQAAEDPDGW